MAFQSFHTEIQFVVGGSTYDVRIQSLSAALKPVKLGGEIAVELFDGRKRQRVDGYRLMLDLTWGQLDGDSNETLTSAVFAALDAGVCDVKLDPDKASSDPGGGQKTLPGMVFTDASSAIEASFDLMVRARPASVSLESDRLLSQADAETYDWITSTEA